MEIDFLGLNNSSKTHQQSSSSSPSSSSSQNTNPSTWNNSNNNGGVETSLSLCSTSSITHQKKKWEFVGDHHNKRVFNNALLCNESLSHYPHGHGNFPMPPHPGLVLVSTPVFVPPFDNNNNNQPRNLSEFSPNLSTVKGFYSGRPVANKAPPYTSAIGVSSEARMKPKGHTPTVAMARKASLARFLEKRLHRMHQTQTGAHLMGKPLNPSEIDHTETRHEDRVNFNIQL